MTVTAEMALQEVVVVVAANWNGNGNGNGNGGVGGAKQKATMPRFREEKKKVDDGRWRPY